MAGSSGGLLVAVTLAWIAFKGAVLVNEGPAVSWVFHCEGCAAAVFCLSCSRSFERLCVSSPSLNVGFVVGAVIAGFRRGRITEVVIRPSLSAAEGAGGGGFRSCEFAL